MTINGEISVRPEEFASAVAWVAKWVTPKPVVPIHAGIAIDVQDNSRVLITAYNENATARATITGQTRGQASGRAIVSGRLLAALAATFGKREPVTISAEGGGVRLAAGKWTGRLPGMPEGDWPTLPDVAAEVGRCDGDALATAVERVGAARGVDPKAGAVFMLMNVAFTGDVMELAATDRYRVAMTTVPFRGSAEGVSVTPWADDMVEAAGAFAGPDEVVVGADEHLMSLTGPRRQIVMRLGATVDGAPWPAEVMRGYIATAMNQAGEIEVTPDEIAMPLKRAGIIGGSHALARVRIGDGVLSLGAADEKGGSDGDEEIAVDYDGEHAHGYFNTRFFGDAFASAPGKVTRLKFSTGAHISKPVLTFCDNDPWRYLTMPVRRPQ